MLFAKFETLEAPNTVELQKWLGNVLQEIQFDDTLEIDENFVKVHFETQRDGKQFLTRVIEDYATLGYETNTEVELFDLSVFVSDPELQAFFMSHRMNIQQCSTEALSEVIVETSNDVAHALELIERMETQATLNGLYKMRTILKVISDELDTKGIHIGETINEAVLETVH